MGKTRSVLRRLIEENTTRQGMIFDYCIQVLILISLIDFSLDTLPDKSALFQRILNIIEAMTATVFVVEYCLRIFVARKPLRYIFSFYGLIDLLAILPYLLALSLDLRSLRAFRVFRVFRALKLLRYNRAINRFTVAARLVREELVLFLMVVAILLFLSSAGIYFFENQAQPKLFTSLFSSAWWSIVTLTTVGYGDVYPVTLGGKVFTFFILMLGVGMVTVPAGLVASALSQAREIEAELEKKGNDSFDDIPGGEDKQ